MKYDQLDIDLERLATSRFVDSDIRHRAARLLEKHRKGIAINPGVMLKLFEDQNKRSYVAPCRREDRDGGCGWIKTYGPDLRKPMIMEGDMALCYTPGDQKACPGYEPVED